MARHERSTYARSDEIIEHAIGHLKRVDEVLETLHEGDHSERVRMLLRSVTLEQRNLLGSMERLLDDLPDKVGGTYEQYMVELPTEVGAPDEPLTTLGLVQWLEAQNGAVHDTFAELAEKEDGELAEVFQGVATQIESHDKRLSKEYQRLEDL